MINLNEFTNDYLIIYNKLNEILNKNSSSTKYNKKIIGFYPKNDYFEVYWKFEDPQYIGMSFGSDLIPFKKLGDLC